MPDCHTATLLQSCFVLHPRTPHFDAEATPQGTCKLMDAAHSGILSDPDKRRRYDQGGFENLNPSDLEVQVDLSSLGVMNTAVAALFSKMGRTQCKAFCTHAVVQAALEPAIQLLTANSPNMLCPPAAQLMFLTKRSGLIVSNCSFPARPDTLQVFPSRPWCLSLFWTQPTAATSQPCH